MMRPLRMAGQQERTARRNAQRNHGADSGNQRPLRAQDRITQATEVTTSGKIMRANGRRRGA